MTSNLEMNICINGKERWDIYNAKKVNFFIGPNNSGKSRFIRRFLDKSTSTIFDLTPSSIQNISKLFIAEFISHDQFNMFSHSVGDRHNALYEFLKEEQNKPYTTDRFIQEMYVAFNGGSYSAGGRYSNAFEEQFWSFVATKIGQEAIDNYNKINGNGFFNKTYIPILRGLRPMKDIGDCFKDRTIIDYHPDHNTLNFEIFTGLSLYKDIQKNLLGTHDKRELIKKFEKFLSVNFFLGEDITLTPMIDKDVVYIKEGEKDDYPIYLLGDGIQSLIILTYAIFTAKKPTIFLIEEPEQHLHAGLQRKLIETILNGKDEHLYFITTHSNHFLDIAQESDEISIQRVHLSEADGLPISEPQDDFGDVLNELGVRASSVLLANCSIWVEGITDKLYLRTFMKKYLCELSGSNPKKASLLKSYFENLHYIFVEYQGSNITHWSFDVSDLNNNKQTLALKLNNKIMLIADSDIKNKSNRVDDLRSALNDKFELLPYKEIENLLPIEIIQKTAVERWKTFNGKSDCGFDDEKILTKADLFTNPKNGVGSILEKFVTNKPEVFDRNFFKDKSGTIKDKVQFCQTAVSIMESDTNWSLTPELTNLCEKIWDHIINSNKTPL